MNELSTNVTIDTIKETIIELGMKSKELCKNIYIFLTNNDNSESRKELIIETGLSKQSISLMFKAGRMYNQYAELDNMSHTNIVELAPLENVTTIKQATSDILGTDDLSNWCDYTQSEIRSLVKNYTSSFEEKEETEKTEETKETEEKEETISKEELTLFVDYLKNTYEIEKDDINTLNYYFSLINRG